MLARGRTVAESVIRTSAIRQVVAGDPPTYRRTPKSFSLLPAGFRRYAGNYSDRSGSTTTI